MGEIADAVVRRAVEEWEEFGRSTRNLANQWNIVGNEPNEPYRSRINRYWRAVGEETWDGATPEPWSGAFISWCFGAAGDAFRPHAKHSRYIDRIRRGSGMSPRLRLRSPSRAVEPGDLIWNAMRGLPPVNHDAAVVFLQQGVFFSSHADVVVAVRDGECDSIGGNVHPDDVGGSVVRSTWRLDDNGVLADPRKTWIGVVKNGL